MGAENADTEWDQKAKQAAWIDCFVAQQLDSHEFINFMWIAETFASGTDPTAREMGTVEGYRTLVDSAWKGHFEGYGQSKVLLLTPWPLHNLRAYEVEEPNIKVDRRTDGEMDSAPKKYQLSGNDMRAIIGLAQLDEGISNHGQPSFGSESFLVTNYLRFCWLPRETCRVWFSRQGFPWPPHFDPKPPAAITSGKGKPKRGAPRKYDSGHITGTLQRKLTNEGEGWFSSNSLSDLEKWIRTLGGQPKKGLPQKSRLKELISGWLSEKGIPYRKARSRGTRR